ncbi:integral membrane channel protein [Grosmannia clavigera kw1407]|uniref:Integral membrane channel protein n=1 Tax=Grosmannia clavigera (strain kw1407 / UAMH 11150) TaxID=655863 RepID=F0XHZ3_GROCL|nr:integral membrane channel protein [Grosmannia clavigera kw1407]EFX03334.1 integral membrane channel protein [Grosmannia clavigera kw1407]
MFRTMSGSRSAELDPLPDQGRAQNTGPDLRRSRSDSLRHHDASPGPATSRPYAQLRHATADFTEADDDEDDDSNEDGGIGNGSQSGGDQPPEDEDGDRRSSQVLPLFSASHLDSLPVYNIVHAIRIIVQTRTDTMLTWEQLRSPQVSQFLVKPMQQLVRAHHFSRATLYALMANCLQFCKEGQLSPGNAGTCSTRGKVCELLAIKLLKEYSTRELIDALSYDFNPLQGISAGPQFQLRLANTARTSTLEVAIRANAKHFLAHPLVVQQLEAIWNGAISFYSSADYLHRDAGKTPATAPGPASAAGSNQVWTRNRPSTRGPARRGSNDPRTPLLSVNNQIPAYNGQQQHQPGKEEQGRHVQSQLQPQSDLPRRRTVTLYNPRNASLFKLSRLRVPRYRQFLSTCSLAVLIALFLAVLVQRSSRITTLELIFWFWSAGFMLDELVGFTEQGFSLYIMSFWNIFDLGILLLLIFYYSLRVCGVFLADAQRWNDNAYDILAANAILLLPRIFSVLDHYQYFSQLLIAFRLMAVDLAAVFVLIIVACSGFFVFFTLSHNDTADPSEVAYKIFQIIMGFTPAAWEVWVTYNFLGKVIMGFFLILCHFVIVTILVTVLSNSFMEIASNANEEHQFLFAINTISMVKNDALFSYVAPTNIFAWMMMPLRYCMPLPHFVALNRLVIKITHFPLLFGIFFYEKFVLAPFMYEPTDLVEDSNRARQRIISFADPGGRVALFSPSIRLREESVVGYQKDRALDEVFRRTPDIASLRTHRRNERRKTQTAVRNWMDHNDGLTVSNYSTLDSINIQRERGPHRFRHISEVRSAASDPADLMSLSAFHVPREVNSEERLRGPFDIAFKDHTTDAEGDDELVTNDEDEDNTTNAGDMGGTPVRNQTETEDEDSGDSDEVDGALIPTPIASRFRDMAARSPASTEGSGHEDKTNEARRRDEMMSSPPRPSSSRKALHSRAISTNTILFKPPSVHSGAENAVTPQSPKMVSPPSPSPAMQSRSRPRTAGTSGASSPAQKSSRRSVHQSSWPQPIGPPKDQTKPSLSRATGTFSSMPQLDTPVRRAQRRMSSIDASLEVSSDLASAIGAPLADDAAFATLSGSFTSQLALAHAINARTNGENDRDRDRMSRLVLARMKTLEESFTDVVRELRSLQKQQLQHHQTMSEKSGSSVPTSDIEYATAAREHGGGARSSGSRTPADQILMMTEIAPAPSSGNARRRVAGSGSSGSDSRSRLGTAGPGKKAKGKEVERPVIDEIGEYESFSRSG